MDGDLLDVMMNSELESILDKLVAHSEGKEQYGAERIQVREVLNELHKVARAMYRLERMLRNAFPGEKGDLELGWRREPRDAQGSPG